MLKLFSLGIVLDTITLLITGLVVKSLWGWFVVTTFGLAAITTPQALGVVLLMGILTRQYVPKGQTIEVMTKALIDQATYPIILFVFGWLIHFWL